MRKVLLCFITALITLTACNTTSSKDKATFAANTSTNLLPDSAALTYPVKAGPENEPGLETGEGIEEETVPYYIVIADTGADYYLLQNKLVALNSALQISIDTMRRTYNPSKDLIALPEDDEDEVYAGDYLPRRHPSNSLSLEYLSFYKDNASEKTIALMAGIFETSSAADSALANLKRFADKAFSIKSNVYVGCIH